MNGRRVRIGWLVLLLACTAAAGGPASVGQVFRADAGIVASSGDEVVDGDLVRTVDDFAILRLDNGHVLRMESNSAAIFRAAADGSVDVQVLSGRLRMFDPRNRLRKAGASSTFTLRPTLLDAATVEARLVELADDAAPAASRGSQRRTPAR